MKAFVCVLIAGALASAPPVSADEPPPPEIFVNLLPARGYVPAAPERHGPCGPAAQWGASFIVLGRDPAGE